MSSGEYPIIAAVALLCACGAHETVTKSTVVEAVQPMPVGEVSLGPGDVFEVKVFGEADLSGIYKVADDGTIDFPLVGQIKVDAMTPHDASAIIAKKLSESYLNKPQVSVRVVEQQSKKMTIVGQVTKPGTFPFVPNMTIMEAIAIAGGFTPLAYRNHTSITRIEAGQKMSLEVPAADIGDGKSRNILVRPGDIISVPERLF